MAGFVLDVSACMPWCCEDEATAVSEQLLQRAARREPLHVPSLWPWEIMNAVGISVRRQRITPERAQRFFEQLAAFDFQIAAAPSIAEFAEHSFVASRHQLTAYDAAYLVLAKQLGVPLATLDEDLKRALACRRNHNSVNMACIAGHTRSNRKVRYGLRASAKTVPTCKQLVNPKDARAS